jgi:sec-independent protein translocase protein TatB
MIFHPAFLEFIGTTEMLVIALVALIIFGPRKLPEIGRTIGKSLGEFKRASEDFKRTWEREVEFERIERELSLPDVNLDIDAPRRISADAATTTAAVTTTSAPAGEDEGYEAGTRPWGEAEHTIARAPSPAVGAGAGETHAANETAAADRGAADDGVRTQDEARAPAQKHDWL